MAKQTKVYVFEEDEYFCTIDTMGIASAWKVLPSGQVVEVELIPPGDYTATWTDALPEKFVGAAGPEGETGQGENAEQARQANEGDERGTAEKPVEMEGPVPSTIHLYSQFDHIHVDGKCVKNRFAPACEGEESNKPMAYGTHEPGCNAMRGFPCSCFVDKVDE